MQTTVEPEVVDRRVVEILEAVGRALGGPRGWEAGPLDCAALLRIAALVGKGMGGDVEQLVTILRTHWDELPSTAHIQAASAAARGKGARG